MRSNQRSRLGGNHKPGVHQGKSKSELVGGQRAGRSSGKQESPEKRTRAPRARGPATDMAREGKGRPNDGSPPRGFEEERARARMGERMESHNKPKRGGTKAHAADTDTTPTTKRKTTATRN